MTATGFVTWKGHSEDADPIPKASAPPSTGGEKLILIL